MRALLIDPIARTVTEVDATNLVDWYLLMDCTLVTSGGRLRNGDVILVDDEGHFKGDARDLFWWTIPSMRTSPLCGKSLVIGDADENGDNTPAKTTLAELSVMWLNAKQAEHMFRIANRTPLETIPGFETIDLRYNPFDQGDE